MAVQPWERVQAGVFTQAHEGHDLQVNRSSRADRWLWTASTAGKDGIVVAQGYAGSAYVAQKRARYYAELAAAGRSCAEAFASPDPKENEAALWRVSEGLTQAGAAAQAFGPTRERERELLEALAEKFEAACQLVAYFLKSRPDVVHFGRFDPEGSWILPHDWEPLLEDPADVRRPTRVEARLQS